MYSCHRLLCCVRDHSVITVFIDTYLCTNITVFFYISFYCVFLLIFVLISLCFLYVSLYCVCFTYLCTAITEEDGLEQNFSTCLALFQPCFFFSLLVPVTGENYTHIQYTGLVSRLTVCFSLYYFQ